jgi:hypothetical protein
MTQHLVFVGTKMVFNSIGFHAAMIVNKLRNEKQITEDSRADAERRAEDDREEEAVRAKLQFVRRRLADLAEFERRARGEKN